MQRRSLSLNVVAILLCIFRYFHCMTDQCMLLVYDVCFGCTFTWFCRNRKFILLVLFIFFFHLPSTENGAWTNKSSEEKRETGEKKIMHRIYGGKAEANGGIFLWKMCPSAAGKRMCVCCACMYVRWVQINRQADDIAREQQQQR